MTDIAKRSRGRPKLDPATRADEQIPLRLRPGTLDRIKAKLGEGAHVAPYVRALIEADLAQTEGRSPVPTSAPTASASPRQTSKQVREPAPVFASRLDKKDIGKRRDR